VFTLFQPATIALIVSFWAFAPASLIDKAWLVTAISIGTLLTVQALEFINERHIGWRQNVREFLTDLFYAVLYFAVIAKVETKLAEEPLASAKHSLGITTEWAMHLPFVAQVALALFVMEFGQYWLHRLMHNSFLWYTHAPHHHITQLELFLVSLSVIALFDLPLNALFCAYNLTGAISAFAHANIRFYTPRWYSFFFTTVEPHSLHHTVGFAETRCNYANAMILIDRIFGTFRPGEAAVVGQDERRRLMISQQFMYPLLPLIAMVKGSRGKSETASG
jgi:sterol desaturase/sphingolipid hydroxylase (fatty acid hydroxylase superfamily)